MLTRSLAAAVATVAVALLVSATSFGGGAAAPALKGTVGPGFTINLTKAGKAVKSLRPGTYKITVADRSAEHNFVLGRQGGAQRQLTSVLFVGTKTMTVKLTKGVWRFYCAPHASGMFGRLTVGGAVLARASASSSTTTNRTTTTTTTPATTTVDDHGGHGEDDEPGDDHGGNSGPGGDSGSGGNSGPGGGGHGSDDD